MILTLITSLVMATPPLAAERRIKGNVEVIPRSLSVYLQQHFPDFSIIPKEEAMAEILEHFVSDKIPQPSPFVCSGDFNGDGLRDFALFLIDRAKKRVKLVAFHQTRKRGYEHFVLGEGEVDRDLASQKIYTYIYCEKPGKKRWVEGGVVNIKTDSIILAFWGKAAELYYFEDNQYKGIITSD